MKSDTTTWGSLSKFINSKHDFTRKKVIEHFKDNLMTVDKTTIDSYISVLTNCGYLERTGIGEYKVLYKIPISFSSYSARVTSKLIK